MENCLYCLTAQNGAQNYIWFSFWCPLNIKNEIWQLQSFPHQLKYLLIPWLEIDQ